MAPTGNSRNYVQSWLNEELCRNINNTGNYIDRVVIIIRLVKGCVEDDNFKF